MSSKDFEQYATPISAPVLSHQGLGPLEGGMPIAVCYPTIPLKLPLELFSARDFYAAHEPQDQPTCTNFVTVIVKRQWAFD
jgi:hypothetical protein